MDPDYNLQDVARCHLCETPSPSLHCDICDIHVCEDCEEIHLTDKSKEHRVVPFKLRGHTTKCRKHFLIVCEEYCEQCNIPVCVECVSSREHSGHAFVSLRNKIKSHKQFLKSDLRDLKEYIYPLYKEIVSDIDDQKNVLNKNSQKLTKAINKHGEDMHREINNIIMKLKSDLDEMDFKQQSILNKKKYEIKHSISEIKQRIADLKKLLISTDGNIVSAYKSRNAEFKKLPPKHTVTLPIFIPRKISKENVGTLSVFIKRENFGNTLDSPDAESSPKDRPLINVPMIITDIRTENKGLNSVSCMSDEEIWTCYNDHIMKLYNLQGELLRTIRSKSGNAPYDISVTRRGDLVYTDYKDRTVNLVTIAQIQTVIRLRGWRPLNVCCTFSGELLVVMSSDDFKKTRVVRYFGSIEKQRIQYNHKGQPLYSSSEYNIKYISENRNRDICVADNFARAIIVVNQDGQFCFTYTGPPSTPKGSFDPVGITTDSQSRILTVDCENRRIHILDQDGQFLRCIDNCDLQLPLGLCLDSRDNLFVAETTEGKVRRIKYNMGSFFR